MSTIRKGHDQLKLLAIYATVVEQQSFAAAARKLFSSRSRVSEQVAKLEQMLGVRLLQRTTRQLNLTAEGEAIYQHALRLNDVIRDVEATVNTEEVSGRVAITLNHDIAHKFLLAKLPVFQQRYPNIKLDLLLEDQAQDLVMEHIDLALRIGPAKDSSMIARVLHKDRFGIFVSSEFLESHVLPETQLELEQLDWIVLPQRSNQSVIQLLFDYKPVELNLSNFQICNSPFMAQQMVLAGLGVSLLLPSTVAEYIESGQLVQILPEYNSEELLFSLMYPSRKQLPKRTQAVIDFLIKEKLFT